MTIDIALLGTIGFPAGFSSRFFMFGLQVVFYAVDLISMKGNGGHASCAVPSLPMQIQYPNRLRPQLRSPFKAQQFEFGINRCEFATSIWNSIGFTSNSGLMNLNEEDKEYIG